ncbi:hypothetical protein PF010_g26791 [Phytophthora fragariae]|uniref:Uncharacterized protein n=1 Tax=Phytophthora fragariae TaxID=53985 RepID=A0A6G0JVS5_9STRA|nr:hypothetical protein PF010_g26791 [Phytophthora fragariae]
MSMHDIRVQVITHDGSYRAGFQCWRVERRVGCSGAEAAADVPPVPVGGEGLYADGDDVADLLVLLKGESNDEPLVPLVLLTASLPEERRSTTRVGTLGRPLPLDLWLLLLDEEVEEEPVLLLDDELEMLLDGDPVDDELAEESSVELAGGLELGLSSLRKLPLK